MSAIELQAPADARASGLLTPEALEFVASLHEQFMPAIRSLLRERERRTVLDFQEDTRRLREEDWRVAPPPRALADRRVEITGPTDSKTVINALNSGAQGFMADFEDATAPSWENLVRGQLNLIGAVRGDLEHDEGGKSYRLADRPATLLVRPRGLHLPERHLRFDGGPGSGSLTDFGLFFFHNARELAGRGEGPFFYLPKLEHWREAELWERVLTWSEQRLELPLGSARATVLIETVPAAFQMQEILYVLREHSAGLNAGRWDYIFSMIKCFADRPEFVLPDRGDVTMTVPFMRAYTELLVRTCHERGAHAMGGMSAFVPSRRDAEVNARALEAVRSDKEREAQDGFDGTWVAHPDLVPVARECFDRVLGQRPNQVMRTRPDVSVGAAELLDVAATPGAITEEGLRGNAGVAMRYIASWLAGRGAVAIRNLMEDAATAEIARSQLWQWLRHGARLDDGRVVDRELVKRVIDEEFAALREELGPEAFAESRVEEARELLERLALGERLEPFLTIAGYERLP